MRFDTPFLCLVLVGYYASLLFLVCLANMFGLLFLSLLELVGEECPTPNLDDSCFLDNVKELFMLVLSYFL